MRQLVRAKAPPADSAVLVAAWALALEVVEGGWAMAEAEAVVAAVVAAVAVGGR